MSNISHPVIPYSPIIDQIDIRIKNVNFQIDRFSKILCCSSYTNMYIFIRIKLVYSYCEYLNTCLLKFRINGECFNKTGC